MACMMSEVAAGNCHRVIMMFEWGCIRAAVRISRWNRATSSASAVHPLDRNRALIERQPDLARAAHAQKPDLPVPPAEISHR
jgi:hypothetical protein